MKKIVLLAIVMMTCASINAQDSEKKKETKTPSSGNQERAINESGISVKSKPQTKSNSKEVQPAAPSPKDDKKQIEDSKAIKKPD